MSFGDCIKAAMDEGSADRERGERAQRLWRDLSDRYERQGHPRHVAEGLAAEDVKTAFKKQAGEKRHVYTATLAARRRAEAIVGASDQIETIATDALEFAANSPNRAASVIGQQRALVRGFHHRIASLLKDHSRDLLGRTRNQAQLRNVVRELHGESTGDLPAIAISDAVRTAFEDLRLLFNEAGGLIGKLENWGLPHGHNARAIRQAGYDAWASATRGRLDWSKMEDHLTGRPLAEPGAVPPIEVQNDILRETFDNIAYGKESREAVYGRSDGESLALRRSHERTLPFRSADDWIEYNKKFGTGDPFATIIGHVHRMARDIAMIREFGPNPALGMDYRAQLAMGRAREMGDVQLARRIEGNAAHAKRMMNILNGSLVPAGPFQEAAALFMSTTRHVLTAAFLDRAVISAISDTNSMRMAAASIGMNPGNVLSRHVRLMADGMSRDEALRAGWIADTLADPGLALARFQSEVPPAELAERLSSGVLRIQGLSHWTDTARIAFQMEMAGHFASQAGRKLADVDEPLRGLLRDKGIAESEWAAFTNPETFFNAANGATFASPIYWRQATDMPRAEADDLFLRLQSIVEEQTEFAVPTNSTWARAFVEGAMPPGSIGYELAKSGLMFKSFTMTFTVNQYRRMMSLPNWPSRASYAANMAAGATVMGAIALQITDLVSGRDPSDMTTPEFWATAALKGGAFGLLGDVAGSAERPFGGLPAYAAGPVLSAGQDAWGLIFGNALNLATGKETHFARDGVRALDRYAPGADLPVLGAALDRMFSDQLLILLDPDAADAVERASRRKARDFWLPGEITPSRLPDFSKAVGG